MKKMVVPSMRYREEVNAYFQEQSSFWKSIYSNKGVYAQIHRDRQATALTWIDSLNLSPGSQVLETGCGAGFMAIALAQKGFHITAIDAIDAMIEQAQQNARESGTADLISLDIGDVYSLAYDERSFDLVVALGVIPWLERPELAIQEMARVAKPGGFILFTADNRARLNFLFDPWFNPLVAPLKRGIKLALEQAGFRRHTVIDLDSALHSRRYIDKLVACAGLMKTKSKTLGFGPFTFLRRAIFLESFGVKLHLRLQHLADRGVFGFRSTGAHYLVLARKPLPVQSMSAGGSISNSVTV